MSEYVKKDDVVRFSANFYHPASGHSVAADSTPMWYVYEDGTAAAILSGTMTARSDYLGSYHGNFTASAGNGFDSNSFYDVQVSGAVDSLHAMASVKQFVLDDTFDTEVTKVSTSASGDIAAAVWEFAGTKALTTQDWSTHSAADVAVIVGASGMIAQAGWEYTTRILTANTNLNDPTAAAIADAVWDEDITAHVGSNKAGQALVTASGNLISGDWSTHSEADVWTTGGRALSTQDWSTHSAADVWSATVAGETAQNRLIWASGLTVPGILSTTHGAGSWATAVGFSTHGAADVWTQSGRTLTNLGSVAVSGDVQAVVEDGLTAYDAATGSDITGLNDPTAAAIADAVWDEDITAHVGGDKAGQALVTASGNLISGDWSTTTAAQMWQYADRSLTHIGSVAVSGDVRGALGLASANLDTQLGDIPTVSEFEARTLVAASYFDPAADTVVNVTTVATTTNLTNLPTIPTDWLTADGLAADAVTEIEDGVWTRSTRTLTANTNLNDPTAAAIADAVWDEDITAHVGGDKAGQALVTASGNLISGDWSTHNAAAIWSEGSRTLTANTNFNDPTAAAIADAVWDEDITAHVGGDKAGQALVTASGNLIQSDIYFADVKCIHDIANSGDEYVVQWFKNDQAVVYSELTNPAMSVYNTSTGAALLSNQTMNFAGSSLGVVRHNETTSVMTSGELYLVVASGSIDSSDKAWRAVLGV